MSEQKHQHTPGPWKFEINPVNRHIELITRKGNTVMDFVRYGMGSAQPRFNVNGLLARASDLSVIVPGREHHREWYQHIKHPDAQLIEAAPDLLHACYAALAAMNEMVPMPDHSDPGAIDDCKREIQQAIDKATKP